MDRRGSEKQTLKPRFVLITPAIGDAERFAPALASACSAADVASVIVRLTPGTDAELLARIRALAPGVHKVGAALLLANLPHLVSAANADGAHVGGSAAVASARAMLKGDHIVGAGALPNRHEAMEAGDSGADYALFGEPDAEGRRPTIPSLVERVAWWADLFVIPCVAYAGHMDEIAPLVRAGADFIALGGELIWDATDGPAAALADAVAHLDSTEPVS